jgi:hypothetical protein
LSKRRRDDSKFSLQFFLQKEILMPNILFALFAIVVALLAPHQAVADCVTTPFRFGGGIGSASTVQSTSGGFPCLTHLSAGAYTIGTSLSVATRPRHGTLTIEGATARYQPKAGFKGFDSYKLKVCGRASRTSPGGREGCVILTFDTTVQ